MCERFVPAAVFPAGELYVPGALKPCKVCRVSSDLYINWTAHGSAGGGKSKATSGEGQNGHFASRRTMKVHST